MSEGDILTERTLQQEYLSGLDKLESTRTQFSFRNVAQEMMIQKQAQALSKNTALINKLTHSVLEVNHMREKEFGDFTPEILNRRLAFKIYGLIKKAIDFNLENRPFFYRAEAAKRLDRLFRGLERAYNYEKSQFAFTDKNFLDRKVGLNMHEVEVEEKVNPMMKPIPNYYYNMFVDVLPYYQRCTPNSQAEKTMKAFYKSREDSAIDILGSIYSLETEEWLCVVAGN